MDVKTAGGNPVAEGITSFTARQEGKLVALPVAAGDATAGKELVRLSTKVGFFRVTGRKNGAKKRTANYVPAGPLSAKDETMGTSAVLLWLGLVKTVTYGACTVVALTYYLRSAHRARMPRAFGCFVVGLLLMATGEFLGYAWRSCLALAAKGWRGVRRDGCRPTWDGLLIDAR
ncbi:MAG: hypothetical protein H5U00_02965 [Clostridia bacterium]|nr:hypothetical protein [Clostridia bacterium]